MSKQPKTVCYPKLQSAMAYHGETQRDLAELLNLSICGISKRMLKKMQWRLDELITLSKHYEIPIEELFGE